MPVLTTTEQKSIIKLFELSSAACRELEESMETGRMSDSKNTAFNLMETADKLPLPPYCSEFLRIFAKEVFLGTGSASGDVYRRCSMALAAAGRLESVLTVLQYSDEDMRARSNL